MQSKLILLGFSAILATAVTGTSAQAESNWTDSIDISGDFRYRLELIDQEDREKRERSSLRARLSLKAQVNDTVTAGVRLASGGDDPVSTNQSFDGFATTKDFGLDRAYVTWKPASGHAVTAGKMAVPFYTPNKSSLVWDSDLNPEGLAYPFKSGGFWGAAGRFNLDECSSCSDSYLSGGQIGYAWKTGSGKISLGLGKYIYDLNTTETGIPDAFDINELLADYSTKLAGRPFVVYANYVNNSDFDDLDTGYEAGFKYGKANPQH